MRRLALLVAAFGSVLALAPAQSWAGSRASTQQVHLLLGGGWRTAVGDDTVGGAAIRGQLGIPVGDSARLGLDAAYDQRSASVVVGDLPNLARPSAGVAVHEARGGVLVDVDVIEPYLAAGASVGLSVTSLSGAPDAFGLEQVSETDLLVYLRPHVTLTAPLARAFGLFVQGGWVIESSPDYEDREFDPWGDSVLVERDLPGHGPDVVAGFQFMF